MEVLFGNTVKSSDGIYRSIRTDDDGNMCVVPSSAGLPFQYFLTTEGDGTGPVNYLGNYSSSPLDIYFEAKGRFDIYTLLVAIDDNGKFTQTGFGAGAALTNGIKVYARLEDGITYVPLLTTGNNPIKANQQWLHLTPKVQLIDFNGVANSMSVAFEANVEYGKPFPLANKERFIVRLNDDFSGLTGFTFGIRGIRYY